MKALATLVRMILKSWFRSRTGVFFSFLFPVMLLLIFGTVFGGQQSITYNLMVQNLDVDEGGRPSDLSRVFINILNQTSFNVEVMDPSLDARNYLLRYRGFGNVRILIIPRGFEERLLESGLSARIGVLLSTLEMVRDQFGEFLNESQRTSIESALSQLRTVNASLPGGTVELQLLTLPGDQSAQAISGIIDSIAGRLGERVLGAKPILSLESEIVQARRLRPVDYYMPGYVAAFIMTNGVVGVTSTVSEYRRRGVLKRLAATPLSKKTWILGNVLAQTVLSLMLLAVMIMVGWIVFRVTAIPDMYSLSLILLGTLTFSGMGVFLGGVVRDVEAATALGNAIVYPMMFLSGSFWPLDIMPSFMQSVARALPLFYFSEGLRQTLILQAPSMALLPFAVMVSLAVIFVALAILTTRWRDL
jgi:ABC-2 type transport system permease protein